MKRTKHIRLILIGGVTAGALAGCSPGKPPITTQNVYTNDYFVPGAGYYHAPFRGWYSLPYNYFDPQQLKYFYGGQWASAPYESIVNVSSPTPAAASQAETVRTDVSRGGFGSSYSGGGSFFS